MRKGLGFHNRRSPGGAVFTPAALFPSGTAGAWYDPSDASTLFSDTAGTTPSPTPGGGALSVVGLMLDKSQGLALGSELVTNGTFTSTSGWTAEPGAGVTLSAANNVLTITQTGGTLYGRAYQALSGLTVGQFYQYTAQVASNPGSLNVQIWAHTGFTGTPAAAQYSAVTSSTGNLVVRFQATATTMYVVMWFNTTAAGSVGFANASVKALPGNHAISYNTTTARPELSARVNLLTYSEQFDNVVWTKSGTAVNTAAGIAPDGTNTANKIYPTSTGAFRQVFRTLTTVAISYVATVYAKAAEKNIIAFVDFAGSAGAAWFNLSTGVASNVVGGYTATITSVGNGWYRCSLTGTAPAGLGYYAVFVADSAGGSTGTANGTDGVLIWGADLRPANIGTSVPAYQRIADQYTYDSSGFPRYLVFNGTASGMYTPANLNLSGTDKATVFAGVRKLDNTNQQMVTEFSANAFLNNGAFWLLTNTNAAGSTVSAAYGILVRGTSSAGASATGTTAPISNVLTNAYNIAAAADAAVLRANGAQVGTSGATSAGTGNFGTYPLNIGVRSAAATPSVFLNGYIYSLIVVGAASTAAQITSTESWINVKEGGVY